MPIDVTFFTPKSVWKGIYCSPPIFGIVLPLDIMTTQLLQIVYAILVLNTSQILVVVPSKIYFKKKTENT